MGIALSSFLRRVRKPVEWRTDGRGKAGGALGSKMAAGSPAERKTGSRKKRGVKTLREAEGKVIGSHSEGITKGLLDKTLKGDVRCAKLLVALAEQQPEGEDAGKSRRMWSAAMVLAAEPERRDELTEQSGETRGGSLEPEG